MSTRMMGLPKGESLRRKYVEFRDSDEFSEMGWAGLVNLGKTHALADCGIKRMFDYPSMNVIISRDTAKNLRESTIKTFKTRIGNKLLYKENNNELIFETPPEPHPVTGDMVTSAAVGVGLDRADLDELFRSREYGTSLIDEGNTVETRAHDIILSRLRQKVYHKTQTILDLALDNAKKWKVSPELAYQAMRDCHRNPVGVENMPLDHPRPAKMIQRTVWNPAPNQMIFDRYFGCAYPEPHPTVEWANKNTGIREKLIDHETLATDRYEFIVGDYVLIDRGMRAFVEHYDATTGMIKLFRHKTRVEYERAELLLQRLGIFGFTFENESRVHENDKIMYFMEDKGLRNRIKRGAGDRKEGRIFPKFRDSDISMGGHTIEVTDNVLAMATVGIGAIDQGGGHATAIPVAAYIPSIRGILIYDGYSKSGEHAARSAATAKEMVRPHFKEFYWGYDPAMKAKVYGNDLEYNLLQEYEAVLGASNLFAGDRSDAAFDFVNSMLEFSDPDYFFGKRPMPRLLIDEQLQEWIEMFKSVTWRHNKTSSHEWVDMADSIKILCSIFRKNIELIADTGYDDGSDYKPAPSSTLGDIPIIGR